MFRIYYLQQQTDRVLNEKVNHIILSYETIWNNIILSLTNIFFQKTNFIWSIWYVIGMLEQKYCNGLTLSRQQQ